MMGRQPRYGPEGLRVRIGLDARYLSHGLIGGVRTYVAGLARSLPRIAPTDEFLYYVDGKAPLDVEGLPGNVTIRMLPWTSPRSSIWNDFSLAQRMDQDGVDVSHFPANHGRKGRSPLVLTIHDALNFFPIVSQIRHSNRTLRRMATIVYVSLATRLTYRSASMIVTGTEHARSEILARAPVAPARIQLTPWSGDPTFRRVTEPERLAQARQRFMPRAGLIVADGIKNAGAVVAAYRRLPPHVRDRTAVAFFSRESAPRADIADAIDGEAIRFLPRMSTTDLTLLMNVATVLAFPSWYEGFGMPLVEAMQCGIPVVASTRGAIPEIVGDAGLLFDVDDTESLARHLEAVLTSETLHASLASKSLARGAAFDWDTTARLTMDVYRSVAARH
jgi:glycosyltransferase involved in cell wall biosynthesis